MRAQPATRLLFGLLLIGVSFSANANLITNGTFDTNLDGWITEGTIPTTWVAGTAHLGAPGQNGNSRIGQFFSIAPGADHLKIWFDYEWQVNPPSTADTFESGFFYLDADANTNSYVLIDVLTELSSNAVFGQTVQFSTQISLAGLNLADSPNNAVIDFRLLETNNVPASAGTRIQLDNIRAEVPEPTSLALMALGLIGATAAKRKFRR